MNHIHAICLAALEAVLDGGDKDYQIRRVLRWYSREFATPLPVVEQLPLDSVLQTYFECQYEALDEKTRLDRAAELTETEEEIAARVLAQKQDDLNTEDFIKSIENKKLEQVPDKVAAVVPTDLPEVDMVFEEPSGNNLG